MKEKEYRGNEEKETLLQEDWHLFRKFDSKVVSFSLVERKPLFVNSQDFDL